MALKIINTLNPSENHDLPGNEIYEGTASAANKLLKRSEVVGQIQTEVPAANEFQYRTNAGVITHVSNYDLKSSFQITFVGDAIHAGEFFPNSTRVKKPIYSEEIELNRGNALHGSTFIIHYSGEKAPSQLVPFGPKSLRPAYADTTAMIAGQSVQSIGDYYTVDNVTFYRLNAKTGVIDDYTTFAAVAGGETWGAKPDWVIVQGDSFLPGVDNRNIITATYFDEIKINSTWYFQTVVVNIQAIPNGNLDDAKPDLSHILELDFTNLESELLSGSLGNNAFHASRFIPEIENIGLGFGVFDALGGGNFAFRRTALNNLLLTERTYPVINLLPSANKILDVNSITIVCRIAFINQGTDPSDITILGNVNLESTKGFAFSRRNASGERRLRFRAYDGQTLISIDSPVQEILRNGSYYTVAVKYEWSPSSRTTKMWIKSTANSLALTQILDQTSAQTNRPILYNNENAFQLDTLFSTLNSSSAGRSVSTDHLSVWTRGVADGDITNLINTLEP